MAAFAEVFAWASGGRDHCAYMWMLRSDMHPGVVRAYPMYHNQTKPNCGTLNTGDIPRMEGYMEVKWTYEENKYNCACSSLK